MFVAVVGAFGRGAEEIVLLEVSSCRVCSQKIRICRLVDDLGREHCRGGEEREIRGSLPCLSCLHSDLLGETSHQSFAGIGCSKLVG